MERVIVRPGDVRGLGDVVEEKTVNDYGFYKSFVAESSETVDNQPVLVFRKGNRDDQEVIRLDFESFVSWYDGLNTFPVTATLVNGSGAVLRGKDLTCTAGDIVLTGRTNSRGQVRFDVPVDGPGEFNLTVEYKVSSEALVYGAVSFAHVFVGVADSLVVDSLMGGGVQESDSTGVVGTVSCRIGDDVYPVHGVPVSFYEEYTKSEVRYTGQRMVNTGDVLPLTARVSDSDGSGIPDEPVSFYEEWEYADFDLIMSDHVVDGDDVVVSARLADSDGSGISGETILFYEEYNRNDVFLRAGSLIGAEDVMGLSAFVRDVDGSRVQVDGVSVSFYEVYVLSDIRVWADKDSVLSGEEAVLSSRLSNELGGAVPGMPVIFYEEFDRVFVDGFLDSLLMVGDVSEWSAVVRDGDGSYVFGSLVEFTEELPSVDWDLDIAYMSDDVVDVSGVVELEARVVDSEGEPVEGVYVRFVGDGLGEEVVVPVPVPPVPTPTVDSISLTSDKDILSFVDGDSCTLTAVALDSNDDPVEGASVEFFNGSTSMGTVSTDSQGIATKTYASAGSGTVNFKASVGSLVSEIYEVEDIYKFDGLTSDNSQYSVTSGGFDFTYGNDGCTMKGTQRSDCYATYSDLTLPDEYVAEFTYMGAVNPDGDYMTEIGFENAFVNYRPNAHTFYIRKNGSAQTSISQTLTSGDVISLKFTGTTTKTLEVYINNVLVQTHTEVNSTGTHRLKSYNNRNVTIKDLKIKAL